MRKVKKTVSFWRLVFVSVMMTFVDVTSAEEMKVHNKIININIKQKHHAGR